MLAMKPRFSLDLTNDSVSLLERLPDGWMRLGEVRLDAADLEGELAALQALASARAPEGFVSKLILPNSQILYFETDAPGQDRAARRAMIRAALSGRTPYDVDDLVFDFTGSGARTAIAVVARVTLEEAEAFAEAQGFRPVAFVAIPEPGRFAGEPFFGLTGSAERWLGDGVRLDRDQDPVKIISVAAALGSATILTSASPDPAPPPVETVQSGDAPAEDILAFGVGDVPAAAAGVDEAAPAALNGGLSAALAATDPEPVAEEAPFIDLSEDEAFEAEAEATDAPSADLDDQRLGERAESEPTPAVTSASPPLVESQAVPDETPTEANAETPFHSRRQQVEGTDLPPPDRAEEPGTRLAGIVPRLGGMAESRAAAGMAAGLAESPRPSGHFPSPVFLPKNGPVPPAGTDPLPGLERVASRIARTSGYAVQPHPKAAQNSLAGVLAGRALAGANMDLPRLAAGAMAMVFLAAALFWAFLSGEETATPADPPVAVVESPATGVADPAPTTETALATAAPPASEPPPDPAASLVQPTVNATAPAVQALPPSGESAALSAAAADAGVPRPAAATTLPDPAALSSDRPLVGQPLPQPFGTLLRRDATGLIIATPEGVITPGGFTLIAGQPARLPRARPAGLVPARPPESATEAALDAPFADPALAGKTPRARPAGLTPLPAATAAPDDGASLQPLAPPVDSRHAARGPKARPAAVAAAAAARRAQDEAVADAAASAARAEAEAAAAALAAASPQAVATSRRPQPRSAAAIAAAAASRQAAVAGPEPASVDAAAVDAALAEAQASPEPETVAAAPEPEPEPPPAEVDEPEPEEGIATLPTTRTVAKKSTYANAIDLGDVNLIGVYGSSSNRRALVRMPNGRFVKVQVGDRLDGGKVAAISDSELRYVKKGKTIVLKIMKNG